VDFKCNKCGSISELVIRADNGTDIRCDSCGSVDMARVFAPVSLKSGNKSEDVSTCSSSKSCSGGSCNTCSGCG
jgi:uncharacterized Zn finger protein